jgi:hypothetical protein
MQINTLLRFFVFFMSVAVGNAFAQLPSEHDGISQGEKTIFLPPNYDFGKPNLGGKGGSDGVSIIWADTLQLLNKSIWNADGDEPIPVSIDTALNLAIETLANSGIALRKSQLLSFSLQYLFFDAAENVWYYDIVFDAAAKTPPLDGKRDMRLHRVIVLMDGTAIPQIVRPNDQIWSNLGQSCAYTKSQGEWKRIRCSSRTSSANPAFKKDAEKRGAP